MIIPTASFTPCRFPGCGARALGPYCDRHASASARGGDRRPSSTQRLYGYKWQKARARFLAERPLCDGCAKDGRLERAAVVDHIRPHKGDMDLFWSRANWQPLCKRCHDAKTARDDGGFGRAMVER